MRISKWLASMRGSFSRVVTIIFVFCVAMAIALSAQTFQTLHGFSRQGSDRGDPEADLVQGADGNFYGTTGIGGLYNRGTVFKITPGGRLTALYSFCGPHNCPDGANPTGTLVLATDGNFYGTTLQGNDGNRERVGSPIAAVTFGQSC